jgi:hypothetical protein
MIWQNDYFLIGGVISIPLVIYALYLISTGVIRFSERE